MSLSAANAAALLRWRLVLGESAEAVAPEMALTGLLDDSVLDGEHLLALTRSELEALDDTLEFVYGARTRNTGLTTYLPRWLGRVREFFSSDVVALVQKDAVERKGLTRLLFEPETLPYLEKNADLVATLLAARSLVPDEAKEIARGIVGEVVAQLRKQLETHTRTALIGAIKRHSRSPLKIARNLDWKQTIRRNLHTYDRDRRRLVPDQFHFLANQRKRHEWQICILVDQSGSMAISVVYSAIMAAIFASLDVLQTKLAYFNHDTVVDMTPHLSVPVDVLFSAQLGGAENYNLALDYASTHFIDRPDKTLLLLITDLYHTAGDDQRFLQQVQALIDSKVRFLVLLKLSDSGTPSFNHALARSLIAIGAHCVGATPKLLVRIVERILKNQPYADLTESNP